MWPDVGAKGDRLGISLPGGENVATFQDRPLHEKRLLLQQQSEVQNAANSCFNYAIFYLSKDLVETDRDVTIITSDSITTGSGLSANLESGLVSVLSNAERKVKDGDNTRIIKGNQMIYNTKTNKWIVKNQSALKLKNSIIKKVKTTFSLD